MSTSTIIAKRRGVVGGDFTLAECLGGVLFWIQLLLLILSVVFINYKLHFYVETFWLWGVTLLSFKTSAFSAPLRLSSRWHLSSAGAGWAFHIGSLSARLDLSALHKCWSSQRCALSAKEYGLIWSAYLQQVSIRKMFHWQRTWECELHVRQQWKRQTPF